MTEQSRPHFECPRCQVQIGGAVIAAACKHGLLKHYDARQAPAIEERLR